MLTGSSSVSSIQNIKWAKIEAIAGDYMTAMVAQQETLKTQLAHLQTLIEEKKAQEAPEVTTEGELTELLEESLASFGSAEEARQSKCGLPSQRPRAPRFAYKESRALFAEKADKLLNEKKRLDGDAFLKLCRAMLLPEGEGDGGYCGPLCQQFKDVAQSISNERAGAAGGLKSEELLESRSEKESKLASVDKDIRRCKEARGTLDAFRAQVKDLRDAQNLRFDELQAAEFALADALYDMDDLSMTLEKEEEALVQAEEALTGEGEKVKAAKEEIKRARDQEEAAKAELKAGLKKLEDVSGKLKNAQKATKTASKMKATLSGVMLMMRLFFDEVALEPLRNMGLDEGVILDDYFEESDARTAAARAVGLAADRLRGYCESTGQRAFAEVKDSVDLSELCDVGEPSVVTSQALGAVKKREEIFISTLEDKVLGWLRPFHHNRGMTEALARERVKQGEPAGYQEIVGVYHKTEFFKYLKKWCKGGPVPALFLSLSTLTEDLSKAVEEAEQFVEGLKEKLAVVQQTRKKVIADLKAAESELAKSAGEQAKVAEVVQSLKERSAAWEKNLEHLQEQVRIAKLNCQKANGALVEALEAVKAGWAEEGQESALLEGNALLARRATAKPHRALLAEQLRASSGGPRV